MSETAKYRDVAMNGIGAFLKDKLDYPKTAYTEDKTRPRAAAVFVTTDGTRFRLTVEVVS